MCRKSSEAGKQSTAKHPKSDTINLETVKEFKAKTRFSFHPLYAARLHQMPLIGADPKEQRIDAYYGSAESR